MPVFKLEGIKSAYKSQPMDHLTEMLVIWLRGGEATPEALVKALIAAGSCDIAREVAFHYGENEISWYVLSGAIILVSLTRLINVAHAKKPLGYWLGRSFSFDNKFLIRMQAGRHQCSKAFSHWILFECELNSHSPDAQLRIECELNPHRSRAHCQNL